MLKECRVGSCTCSATTLIIVCIKRCSSLLRLDILKLSIEGVSIFTLRKNLINIGWLFFDLLYKFRLGRLILVWWANHLLILQFFVYYMLIILLILFYCIIYFRLFHGFSVKLFLEIEISRDDSLVSLNIVIFRSCSLITC